MNTCIECGTKLTGRQTKYCSQNCNRINWAKLNSEKVKISRQKWAENNVEHERTRIKTKYKNAKIKNNNRCTECGKLIHKHSKKCLPCSKGENAHNWKGDDVKYTGLHTWIKRHKPPSSTCEFCNKNKLLELANISGEYKRNIDDYKWLCRSCHRKWDLSKLRVIKHIQLKKDIVNIFNNKHEINARHLIKTLSKLWGITESGTRGRLKMMKIEKSSIYKLPSKGENND